MSTDTASSPSTAAPSHAKARAERLERALRTVFLREERAVLAHLRQGVYDPTGDPRAIQALGQAYQAAGDTLPGDLARWDLDAQLVAACLFALYAQPFVAEGRLPSFPSMRPDRQTLGTSAQLLRRALSVGQESLDQRFTALLNSHADDLPGRLRHLVQRLSRAKVPLHFGLLLRDVRRWPFDARGVRRRWAAHYWQPLSSGADDDAS